uniref:BHLH domain-containing protein n=1 Tax=Ciona savignyi TaxID=51511 RepID=H2Y4K6_CIOSA
MSIQTLLEAVEFLETSSNKSNLGGFASENSSKKDEKDSNDNEQKNEHQNNPHFPTNPTDQSTTADSASTNSSMTSQPAAMTSSTNPLFSQTLPLNLASYFDVNRKILNNSHSNSQQHRSNAPTNSVAPEIDAKSLETSSQAILPDGSHRNNISYAKQPDKADLKWIAANSNTLQGHTVMCSNDKQLDSNIPLNSLLPSLVKSTEDEKAFCALQFKQIKRQVTLTHNQLEKIRRAHLKECFEALKSQLPGLGIRRSSNLTILKAANRHIKVF